MPITIKQNSITFQDENGNSNNSSAFLLGSTAALEQRLDTIEYQTIAPAHSIANKAYVVGDYVMYNDNLYKCKKAHTSTSWVAANWTKVSMVEDYNSELTDLKSAVNVLKDGEVDGVRHVAVWKNGSWTGVNYALSLTNASNRIRPDYFIPVVSGDVITITNGAYVHAVGLWSGTIDTHVNIRNDNSFSTNDETIEVTTDGFFIVAYALADDTTSVVDPANFNGDITITSYTKRIEANIEKEINEITKSIEYGFEKGKYVISKNITWENGYVNDLGLIKSSTASQFACVEMKKGETIKVGTKNSNITIIASTTANSVSVGDTVTVIQKTTISSEFETHVYTAEENITLVICVAKSNYTLVFYKDDLFVKQIADGYLLGSVVSNGSFFSDGRLSDNQLTKIRTDFIAFKANDKIIINNGSFEHIVGIWNGIPATNTNKRNDGTWISVNETIVPDYDGYMVVVFKKSDNSNITIDDFDGEILLYQTIGYRAYATANNSGTYDLPAYYFENDYIKNKADRINALGKTSDDIFCFITDIHWERNARHSPDLIKYITSKCSLFKVFNGGDVADSSLLPVYKKYRTVAEKNYYVCGNHDWFSPSTGKDLYYCMDAANNDQIGNPFMHYWYSDNVQQKIRYIILNCFSREENSTTLINEYDNEQISWLQNTALSLPDTDWDVIIFTHMLKMTTPVGTNASLVESVIDNFNADTNHTGKILAVLQGHTHWDAIYHTNGGVPIITTTCDKYDLSNETSTIPLEGIAFRELGTIKEQAFDIMALNRENKTITAVRIGALAQNNIDKYRTDSGFTWIGTLEERIISYDVG